LPYQNLFVTDFKTWDAVVDWALNIYEDNVVLSKKLKAKIEYIKNSSKYEGERITATLKFVQDEIRYLSLESGIGAYKPFSPNKVLQQRFGECKDKSWLMVAMLRNMGIKAYPCSY
jgi:transglutaminase-like putative cysteine protease